MRDAVKRMTDMRPVVLVDNGHGEETAGKRSPDGRLLEWRYTREIAREVVRGLALHGVDGRLLVPGTGEGASLPRDTGCAAVGACNTGQRCVERT